MGTCYDLIRRDTMTGYDLGKAWHLHHVFEARGHAIPMQVTLADVPELAELMARSERGDLEIANVHWSALEPDRIAYWTLVAADIVDWSEGQPFEFHSEHSRLHEEISLESWDRDPPRKRLWTTGDRHDSRLVQPDGTVLTWATGREELARRRREDEAFRRGNVWHDYRTNTEIVQTTPE